MSTAPAPRDFDTFDDAFDVDMEFVPPVDDVAAPRPSVVQVFNVTGNNGVGKGSGKEKAGKGKGGHGKGKGPKN